MHAWGLYALCTGVSLILGFVFLILLCACAGFLTWFIFITLSSTLFLIGSMLFVHLYGTGPLNNSVNAMRVKYLSFLTNNQTYLTILGVCFILLGFILLFMMCKKFATINKSSRLISLASKMSIRNILLLFLSIFIVVL